MTDRAEQVRQTLVGAVQATSDVAQASRKAVKGLAVGALKDAGEVAANAAIFAGTVKSAIIGVADAGRGATEGVRGAAGGIIQAASEVGVDLAQASANAMRGVMEAAATSGEDSGKYMLSAIDGMLEAADAIGEHAVTSVKRGLVEIASIPREVVDAAVRGEGRPDQR